MELAIWMVVCIGLVVLFLGVDNYNLRKEVAKTQAKLTRVPWNKGKSGTYKIKK
jgi:hypothetical protein